jgi:DNA polymerase III delta subunit
MTGEFMETEHLPARIMILHGDDLLAIEQQVHTIASGLHLLKDNGGAEAIRLNGRSSSWDDLHTAVDSLPFLTPHQLVIIDEPLGAYPQQRAGRSPRGTEKGKGSSEMEASGRQKDWQERFLSLLTNIPASTTLLLLLLDEFTAGGKRRGWGLQRAHSWLADWVANSKGLAEWKTFQLPNQRAVPGWIIGRCSQLGVRIQGRAAEELAMRTGNDTMLAEQELAKLITYKGPEGGISLEDVRSVSVSGGQADVFRMIDAVVEGRKQEALRSLHILLSEQEPQGVFALFVRHFRYLILVRELLDKGGKLASIAESVRLPDWQVEKMIAQLRRFKMDRLSKVYHLLLRMDVDSKSGGTPLDVALDELVLTV